MIGAKSFQLHVCGVVLTLCLGSAAYSYPQDRSHARVLAAFRDVVSAPAKSTVQILSDGKRAALGAVVGADGFVLTKASELKGKLQCRLFDGKLLDAQIVGREPSLDLAMLKIDAKELPVIVWSDTDASQVGSLLVTPGLERDPVAIGVLSVGTRKIPPPSGALGVKLAMRDDSAQIEQVLPNLAADKAGLQDKDIIAKINGKEIKSRQQLVETIRGYTPGEKVELTVRRGDQDLALTVTLGSFSQLVHGDRAEFQNGLGGALSERRAGFPAVIQHDSVLKPADCGGPIVDLEGKTVGINIARAGRVESYALPASVIKGVLADLMSGKLAPIVANPKLAETPTAATKDTKAQ